MWTSQTNLSRINVVSVFNNQDDADEAVLGLRVAGFRDSQIGYYSWTQSGAVDDLLERNYWMTGATLGAVAGAIAGVLIALSLPERSRDLFGFTVLWASFSSLTLGVIGGLIGSGVSRRQLVVPGLGPTDAPFVVTVSAGPDRERALAIILQHGGHEIERATAPMPVLG